MKTPLQAEGPLTDLSSRVIMTGENVIVQGTERQQFCHADHGSQPLPPATVYGVLLIQTRGMVLVVHVPLCEACLVRLRSV